MEKVKSGLDEKIEEYKGEFSNLSDEEIGVLAYRKIYEIKKEGKNLLDGANKDDQEIDDFEKILAIVLATDRKVSLISSYFIKHF